MSDNYKYCKELLYGLVGAIPKDKVEELYQDHLVHPTTRLRISLQVFVTRHLKGVILNKLIQSEVGQHFIDLTQEELAKLLGMSNRKLNSTNVALLKRLSAFRLNPKCKSQLAEMRDSVEELGFVEPTLSAKD